MNNWSNKPAQHTKTLSFANKYICSIWTMLCCSFFAQKCGTFHLIDGAAYAEHTVRVFQNKSPTNRPWAWNLEDSRIRKARASQPANVFALILSLCVSDTFPTIARSSVFSRCYFSANFYDAHHQYHLRISFFSRTHLIASRPIIWTRWKPRKIFVPIPYHMCSKRNADTLQFNHYH